MAALATVSGQRFATYVTGSMIREDGEGPIVAVYPAGRWYRLETHADVARFATALAEGDPLSKLAIHEVHHEVH